MNKINKFGVALTLALTALVAGAAGAWATPTVEDQVTDMATDAFGQAGPILLAVAAAAVSLAVISFGARLVLRAVRSGGRI